MGVYTNYSVSHASTNYTEVAPFVGENFNYHELGIMAATEMAQNHDAFMKSIALSELAAYEETGSTDVLYEAVNFAGIFAKIKAFFKKVIEKIHKIFHTFIAKMSSWFGGNASFAKKYEKEVVKGWANVKSDWEFKGYEFENINFSSDTATKFKVSAGDYSKDLKELIEDGNLVDLLDYHSVKNFYPEEDERKGMSKENLEDDSRTMANLNIGFEKNLSSIRDKLNDIKDAMRGRIITNIGQKKIFDTEVSVDTNGTKLDSGEYTEELFKVFRKGEDSKSDLSKDKIVGSYGGSITGLMTYIKEFDKIKSKTESAERKFTSGIDSFIKKIDKSQNDLLKKIKDEEDTNYKKAGELIVQGSTVIQSLYGALSEVGTQAFSAFLQAQKDACVQAKEIAVKVIGQSKKMTEESYDYSNEYSGSSYDFIGNVKLV